MTSPGPGAAQAADAVSAEAGHVAKDIFSGKQREGAARLQRDDAAELEVARKAVSGAARREVCDQMVANVLVGVATLRSVSELVWRQIDKGSEIAVVDRVRVSVIGGEGEQLAEVAGIVAELRSLQQIDVTTLAVGCQLVVLPGDPAQHTALDLGEISADEDPALGCQEHGTQAAGELVTSEEYLEKALRTAPPDWRRKNIQIVVQTTVTDSISGPPQTVAVYVW